MELGLGRGRGVSIRWSVLSGAITTGAVGVLGKEELGPGIGFLLMLKGVGMDLMGEGGVLGMGGSDLSRISRGRDVFLALELWGSAGGTRTAPCRAS
jgi:hypothetical protein